MANYQATDPVTGEKKPGYYTTDVKGLPEGYTVYRSGDPAPGSVAPTNAGVGSAQTPASANVGTGQTPASADSGTGGNYKAIDPVTGEAKPGYYTTNVEGLPEGYTVYRSGEPNAAAATGQATGQGAAPETRGPNYYKNNAPDVRGWLDAQYSNSMAQAKMQTDYNTRRATQELERAQQDAEKQFADQQKQIAADEAKALDNQALYAEARGDRGGIGQAQYGQIQNAAMQNRQSINNARTKLATDTARQIADLRAQGEYEKANAVLQLTQSYLKQLADWEQWNANYALEIEKLNRDLDQWWANYDLSLANITGRYNGQPTYAAQKDARQTAQSLVEAAIATGIELDAETIAAAGYTPELVEGMRLQAQQQQDLAVQERLYKEGMERLKNGIPPTKDQLKALGMTEAEAQSYIADQKNLAWAKITKSGSKGGSSGSKTGSGDWDYYGRMYAEKNRPKTETEVRSWLAAHKVDKKLWDEIVEGWEDYKLSRVVPEGETAFETWREAMDYMTMAGAPLSITNLLVPEVSWNQRRKADLKAGKKSEYTKYDTYAEYLNAFIYGDQ